MKKLYILLVVLWSSSLSLSAQTVSDNNIIRGALDVMFEGLDKTKVPTGYLSDYAVDLVNFNQYSGVELTDSNYVSASVFEALLSSMMSASVGSTYTADIPQIMTSLQSSEDGVVNMAYMFFRYNYIKENALQDNLINYTAGKVSDSYIDGEWQNPYGEAYVFAVAPGSNVLEDGSVTFRFSSSLSFFNKISLALRFDAGDGNGYRPINTTSVISVDYSTPGVKELKFAVIPSPGVTLVAHSSIYVKNVSTSDNYQQSVVPSPSPSSQVTINHKGEPAALVSIYCKTGNTRITRPFIVVEGFDVWELMNEWKDDGSDMLGVTNHEDFYNNPWLLKDIYDLIYIDWFNPTASIVDNAETLMKVIRTVNQIKVSDSCDERTIILGQSMGGLIVRVALSLMESLDEPHGMSTYISHDVPHLGANVPLGALYFIHQALSFLSGYPRTINLVDFFAGNDINDARKQLWSILHSPAARQMLVNYVNEDGVLDNSEHDSWQAGLENMGFPQGDPGFPLEKLAIVNGYVNNQSDIFSTLYGYNYMYMLGHLTTSYLADILFPGLGVHSNISFANGYPGSNRFIISALFSPLMSYGALISNLYVNYIKIFSWTESESYVIFNERANAPSTGFLYDRFPGSLIKIKDTLEFDYYPQDTMLSSGIIGFGITDRMMLIPTASALSMYSETNLNYTRNYYLNPPEPLVECPFDAYSLADSLENHIKIGSDEFRWICQQVNMKIEGPSYVSSNETFNTVGYTGPLTWKSSNETAAVIDNHGRLTITGGGNTTLTAEYYSGGKLYRKTKDIVVSFPDVVISSNYAPGEGYTFSCTCVNSESSGMLEKLVSQGVLQYEWSLLDAEGNRITTTSSSDSITFLPDEDELLTVSLRLVDTEGNKGKLKSVSFSLKTPMRMNYKFVVVDSQQNVYFIREDNTYELGVPTEDYSACFRGVAMNTTDNVNSASFSYQYLKGDQCYLSYPFGIRMTGYMSGTKIPLTETWTFGFFDTDMFLDKLEEALVTAGTDECIMTDFYLTLCNSEKEPLQDIPFVIIYKPVFPEN